MTLISVLEPRPAAKVRLICFPAAGANSAIFSAWPDHLYAAEIAVARRETGVNDYATLVQQSAEAMQPYIKRSSTPYALFGHSLGALLAYGVADALRNIRTVQPIGLLLAAASHPRSSHRQLGLPLHEWTQADVVTYLRRQGGTPQHVLDNPVLFNRLLPRLQADLTMLASYVYTQNNTLDCPIAVFGGLEDEQNPPSQLEQWKAYTHRSFALHMFPGNHFFFHNPVTRPAFLNELAAEITQWLELKTTTADEKHMSSAEGKRYVPRF
ncbi:MAG TPA: alpha/beta fold hydrolase [Ktedonobacteraceae bacterium]|nr:alpha/beta fold hydrolase [Ktedonobacteraceae bacterium]